MIFSKINWIRRSLLKIVGRTLLLYFKVWVLTGDKEQTAVQISKAAGHFLAGSGIITLTNGQDTAQVASAINQYLSDLGLDGGEWFRQ